MARASVMVITFADWNESEIEDANRPELQAYVKWGIDNIQDEDHKERMAAYFEGMGHDLVSLIEMAYDILDS